VADHFFFCSLSASNKTVAFVFLATLAAAMIDEKEKKRSSGFC